tara:strand:- start:569 stop:838 length:270 start_codon:yes stop_codon:yes gene_type:complete
MEFQGWALTDYFVTYDQGKLFSIYNCDLLSALEQQVIREFRLSDHVAEKNFSKLSAGTTNKFEYCSRLIEWAKEKYQKKSAMRHRKSKD